MRKLLLFFSLAFMLSLHARAQWANDPGASQDAISDVNTYNSLYGGGTGSAGAGGAASILQLQVSQYGYFAPVKPTYYSAYETNLTNGKWDGSGDSGSVTTNGELHVCALELISIRRLFCAIIGLMLVSLTKQAWERSL